MKILQVILSSGFAGSERHVADLCTALASRGHEVVLAVARDHRDAAGGSIRDGLDRSVTVAEIGKPFQVLRLGALIRRERPAVIHAHLKYAGKLAPWAGAGVPTVSTLHLEYKHKHFHRLDAIICIAGWQRATIYPDYRGRLYTIPNSTVRRPPVPDAARAALRQRLGIPPGAFVFGSVGRLNRTKGFDLVLAAFAQAAIPDALLLIVGDGPERAALAAAAGDRVRLLGFRADARDLFPAFDAFVSAARFEPFGLVLLEAMDAGLPIIASRSAGALEILPDTPATTPAILVPVEDVPALAAAMRRTAETGPHRVAYDLGRYDPVTWVERIEGVYRDLID